MVNMTFIELANKRRSVRRYATTPIPKEVIARCLEAARIAPSACNAQPWQFIIIDDKILKDKVADAAFGGPYSMNSFAKKAPVLVVVLRDKASYFAAVGGAFRGIQFSLIDIGIAAEHFVLQAVEEGVGTCWLGWFNERAVKKALGIPSNKKADIMISMGYPENEESREKMRKNFAQMSKFNK